MDAPNGNRDARHHHGESGKKGNQAGTEQHSVYKPGDEPDGDCEQHPIPERTAARAALKIGPIVQSRFYRFHETHFIPLYGDKIPSYTKMKRDRKLPRGSHRLQRIWLIGLTLPTLAETLPQIRFALFWGDHHA